MRTKLAIAILVSLGAGIGPAADRPAARPVETPKPLSKEARAELCNLLPMVAPRAKAEFAHVAMTIEQARRYAKVDPKMTWQVEFCDWFVFSVPGPNGGPDRWSGVVLVQKGTNLVGYYREKW